MFARFCTSLCEIESCRHCFPKCWPYLDRLPYRYHIYWSKRHIRPLRTILFGGLGLGLRVGVLGVVRIWVRVSERVRVGVSLVRG